MFYSQIILAKKGPLGMIWLASHWLEKLKKVGFRSVSANIDVFFRNKKKIKPFLRVVVFFLSTSQNEYKHILMNSTQHGTESNICDRYQNVCRIYRNTSCTSGVKSERTSSARCGENLRS